MYGSHREVYTGRTIVASPSFSYGKRVTAMGGLWDDVTHYWGSTPATRKADTVSEAFGQRARDLTIANETAHPTKTFTPTVDTVSAATRVAEWIFDGVAGEYLYVWHTWTTWFDLAARYLGDGKRYPEIWAYQTAALRQELGDNMVRIYSGAHIRMPAAAIARARELGELPKNQKTDPNRPRPATSGAAPAVTLGIGLASSAIGALVHWYK